MKQLLVRIKKFYNNESFEEEKTIKIATTILIIFLLLITPVVTHYKNVYWTQQYEKASVMEGAEKNMDPSPDISASPVPTEMTADEETGFK